MLIKAYSILNQNLLNECAGKVSQVILNNGKAFNFFTSTLSGNLLYGFIDKHDISYVYHKTKPSENYTLLPSTNIPKSCKKSLVWLNLKGGNRNFWFYYHSTYDTYLYGAIYPGEYKEIKCTVTTPIFNISGNWETSCGNMALFQQGANVTGNYGFYNGHVQGILTGNILKGIWYDTPDYAPQDKSRSFIFKFSNDGKSFAGTFGKGDNPQAGSWTGRRI